MDKYYIDEQNGLHAVMFEDIPVALFPRLMDAQIYLKQLLTTKVVNLLVEERKEQYRV